MTIDINDFKTRLLQSTEDSSYDILQQVIELNKQGKISDKDAFELLKIKQGELSQVDERFARHKKPELRFNLTIDDILSNPILKEKGLPSHQLTDSDKLKQFMFNCLIEAKNNNYKFPHDSLIYSDAGHDIDDQMALAKEMALTILLGGSCVVRMNGHAPFSAISIHKELFESMLALKDQLLFDIKDSLTLKPDIKDFCKANSSKTDRSQCVQFFPQLIPDDLADRNMHIGQQDFFQRPYPPFTQDYFYYLFAKLQKHKEDQHILTTNDEAFEKSTQIFKSRPRKRPVKVQIISKIDRPEILRLRSDLDIPNKQFFSQGGKTDFNLGRIKDHLEDINMVTVNNSLITSFGLGQVDSAKVEEQSFFRDMLLHLDDQYAEKKQTGWARSGMQFNLTQDGSLVTRTTSQTLSSNAGFGHQSLSFEGLYSSVLKIPSATSFPVGSLLNFSPSNISKLMTPHRFLLELKKRKSDGSLENVHKFSTTGDCQILEFNNADLKELAIEFYKKHHEFENKILITFVGLLDSAQKTSLSITDSQAPDIEALKLKLADILPRMVDIQQKLRQAINTVYEQEDPLTFYRSKVKDFCRTHPEYVRTSILYDTTIPAITRLLDSQLTTDLLAIQNTGTIGSGILDLSADLMNKIKNYLDNGLESDKDKLARIRNFYETVCKLKTTLNESLFAPESVAKESLTSFTPKFGYSHNDQMLIPIYRQDSSDSYKSIKSSEGFSSFTTDPNFTFVPGATYHPYYDEHHQPKLAMSNEAINLDMKLSNQFKIELCDSAGKAILCETFTLPPQQITQSQSNPYEYLSEFSSTKTDQTFAPTNQYNPPEPPAQYYPFTQVYDSYQFIQPPAQYPYVQSFTQYQPSTQAYDPHQLPAQYRPSYDPHNGYQTFLTPQMYPNSQPTFNHPYTLGSSTQFTAQFPPAQSFDSMHQAFSSHLYDHNQTGFVQEISWGSSGRPSDIPGYNSARQLGKSTETELYI